jgi:maltoporin
MRWQVVAPLGLGLALAGPASAQPQPGEPAEPTGEAPEDLPVEPAPVVPVTPTAPDNSAPQPFVVQPVPAAADKPRIDGEGFRFGSYGRATAGSDLRGGKPEKILIVAHGPRIVEDSYLELEFSYGFVKHREAGEGYIALRPVITLAFDGTLFHDTGEFDARPALRNMYLDARIAPSITAWAGSRMYRGDDIYLFDFWPLDDQNMVGAGAQFSSKVTDTNEVGVAAAVGFNRLNHPFQFQAIDVANPVQGATTVEQLNRQRIVASASAQYLMLPTGDGMGSKLKVHTEVHSLPSGTRKREDGTLESLPADTGFLIGAEAGVFGFSANPAIRRHLNLFARYANGLAAFDELAPPTSFGPQLKTGNANELSFGVSGNFDHELGQLMVGALSRRFIDADTTSIDPDDGWEYAIGARPLARIVPEWYVGGDVSYQARFPRGLNPITLRADDPAMLQIAPMIVYSPMGPSAYDRPQLRLVYRTAHLNDAALDTYVPDDPRHDRAWVHFLGVQAEWWFNSSRYR